MYNGPARRPLFCSSLAAVMSFLRCFALLLIRGKPFPLCITTLIATPYFPLHPSAAVAFFLQRFASSPFGEAAPLCIAASSFTPSFSAVSPMRRLYLFSCVLLLIRERPFPFAQRFFSPLSFSRCIFLRRLHFSPAFRLAPIRRRPFPFSPFRCAAYHHVRIKWNRRFHGRHGFPLSPPPSLPAIRRLFLPFSGKHQYTNFGASRKGKAPKYTFSFTNRPAKQPRCTALARTFGVSPAAAAPASISNMSPS